MAQYDEHTGPDGLHYYLSGASSDGGSQTDPELSLGNYRSSTRVNLHTLTFSSEISNITVQNIGGLFFDSGILSVDSTDVLKFAVDGGSGTSLVTILNGETKLIPTSVTGDEFIVVTRTSTDALSGTTEFIVTPPIENVFAGDNVTTEEATDGDDEYRAIFIKNASSKTITNVAIELIPFDADSVDAGGYAGSGAITITSFNAGAFSNSPEAGWVRNLDTNETMYYSSRDDDNLFILATGRDIFNEVGGGTPNLFSDPIATIPMLRFGLEAPSAPTDGFIYDNTSAGIKSAPVGVTFDPSYPGSNDLKITTMLTNEQCGLWIWRKVDAPMVPLGEIINQLQFSFSAHDN